MNNFKLMASHIRKDIKPWFQYFTKETGSTLKIKLNFQNGGMNMGTYKTEQKGYYLSLIPMQRELSNGMVIETVESFAGMKFFIEAAGRYNEKRLTMIATQLDLCVPIISRLWSTRDAEGVKNLIEQNFEMLS